MADVHLCATISPPLKPRAEFVTLTGRVQRINYLANGVSNEVLRNFGAILGPASFHHPGLRVIDCYQKPILLPEIFNLGPQ